VIPTRVAVVVAAVACAAVLHLAAAPGHFPPPDPPGAVAHPGHRHAAPPASGQAAPTSGMPAGERRDMLLLGWSFVLAGLFGLGCCWWLLTRALALPAALLVAGGHAAMMVAGVASRTVGLLGHKDPWWEAAFVLAMFAEAVVVWLLLAPLLWPARQPAPLHT
jgi:hypothetical protein